MCLHPNMSSRGFFSVLGFAKRSRSTRESLNELVDNPEPLRVKRSKSRDLEAQRENVEIGNQLDGPGESLGGLGAHELHEAGILIGELSPLLPQVNAQLSEPYQVGILEQLLQFFWKYVLTDGMRSWIKAQWVYFVIVLLVLFVVLVVMLVVTGQIATVTLVFSQLVCDLEILLWSSDPFGICIQ